MRDPGYDARCPDCGRALLFDGMPRRTWDGIKRTLTVSVTFLPCSCERVTLRRIEMGDLTRPE